MYTDQTKVRVRYGETDQMGFAYYGVYAQYYEVARVEAFRKLGISYKELEEGGTMMPVLELKTRYHGPAYYDEELTVKVSIPQLPSVRILFTYEVLNEKSELINTGETTLVFTDKNSGRPKRTPELMINLLKPYFKQD